MLGVASVALRACSIPQSPSSPLVGLWSFDETGVGAVFEDIGPGNVPMTIVGTWADLSTGSIVQGVDGTSAYTSGGGYATLPANQPAHALSALTISFYYQRASAASKQILLAAGDGSEAGDFSIEVPATGRLRGWHTGQDARLRFFEASDGITGTNLQVGTAYRIELSLGPDGARIYLDGAELTAAAIPANVNGWNNAREKYLGRWTDGVLDPAVGVFDRLRVWHRQLSNAEIALLEPAQSTALPSSQTGEAPLAPSLTEWLVSDEVDPTVTKYVSNQNRGNGSGSSPANAQEVQAALNGAAPGSTFLAVCQTPGTIEFWDYPNGLNMPNGSSGNFITLQARNGDGVVISAGEDFSGASSPGSGFWTQSGLSQSDIDKKIWRSVSTFSGGEQTMMGIWIEFEEPHQLVRAINMTNLRAAYGQENSPTNYATPMVHKDSSGRVYIRMQKPHPVKYSRDNKWSSTTWPGYPEAISNGQLNYPLSEDPNDYPIHLWRVSTTHYAFNGGGSGHHWKIGAGINSMGYRAAFQGGNNIHGDRGLHWTWQQGIASSSSGSHKSEFYFNRTRWSMGHIVHTAINDWKFGGWNSSIRSVFFNAGGDTACAGMYFKDCTIGSYHEMCTSARFNGPFRWRNCTFYCIFDDGIQARYSMTRTELGYCYFYNSDWGGMGEGGSDGDDPNPGGWYVHHNILDCRREKVANWRAQPHPQDVYTAHSPDGRSPRKIYNNLFIGGPDRQEEEGYGLEHAPAPSTSAGLANTLSGASLAHQVFNNIVLRVYIEGTKRYDPVVTNPDARYSDNFRDRSDFVSGWNNRYSANASNELFDYNLYWRPASMTVDPKYKWFQRGPGQTNRAYDTLAEWYADTTEFSHSKQGGIYRSAYGPGWEGNGTDDKPSIGTIDNYPADRFTGYRPLATAAVTVGSSGSLNGANWWNSTPTWGDDYFPWNDGEMTLAPGNFKGPLDPNGLTMPVGVQNP